MTRSSLRASVLASAFAVLPLSSISLRHPDLRRSDPAKDSRLTTPPPRIGLWFTARPEPVFSRIRLIGPAGDVVLGNIVADTDNALRAEIQGAMGVGTYRVVWQTAGADGHAIRGEYSFVVVGAGQSAPTGAPPGEAAIAVQAGRESVASAFASRLARWCEFLALLTMLGALGFRHGVLPPLATRHVQTAGAADRARRLGLGAVALYAIAVLVRLFQQAAAVEGSGRPLDPGAVAAIVTGTTWGIGWMLGLVGALLVLAGWTVFKRSTAIGTPLALTGALGLVLSPALSGHAAASGPFILSLTLDMVHVAAAGVWVGGLLMVLAAGIPAMRQLSDGNRDAAVSALINSFHPVALFCAPLVILAGLGSSWIRLGSVSALLSTLYGRTLVLKVGLVALVAMMGAYNSMRARRRLGTNAGTRQIIVSASMELVLAALVLAVTTALVATPVPSEMVAP